MVPFYGCSTLVQTIKATNNIGACRVVELDLFELPKLGAKFQFFWILTKG